MPQLRDAVVFTARQDLFQMAHAEHLPRAIGGGQELARQFGGVMYPRRVETVIAIAALFGWMFAEMADPFL